MGKRKIYRTLPCAKFDIGRIESWLTDMAARGWHLKSRGLLFCFEKGEPRQVRYRLEPKRDFGDSNDKPEAAVRELYEVCGWEAVTDFGQFFIFRSSDPQAREIHTDPVVHAQAVKRLLRQYFAQFLLEAFLLGLMMARLLREPFRYLVTFGAVYTCSFAVLLMAAMAMMLHGLIQLLVQYRQLKTRKELDHSKPWRKGAFWHRAGNAAMVLMYAVFLATLLTQCTNAVANSQISVDDYPGDPPFVTIRDLYPEGEYSNDTTFAGYNHYAAYSSDCAPVNIEWREYATVVMPNGEELEGGLIVHYHETAAPWIAEGLAKEYLRMALKEDRHQPMQAPEIDANYVAAYSLSGIPTLILQEGNAVITAGFTVNEEDGYPVEKWAERMLQMLK